MMTNPNRVLWLHTLWVSYNRSLFREQLRSPMIELSTDTRHLGAWLPDRRAIIVSEHAFTADDAGFAHDVLRHEMVHQYVDEVLRVHDETPHGPAFQRVARQVGALLHAGAPASEEPSPALRRVRKLLALAGSPNQAEAEAAMVRARQIMARTGLSRDAADDAPPMAAALLGRPTARRSAFGLALSSLIVTYFDVYGIWIEAPVRPRHRIFEILGRPEAVTFAAWVHDWLTATAERLWVAHRAARGLTSDAERQRFLTGVIMGFMDKLHAQNQAFAAEGLVPVRPAEVEAFARARYPRVQHRRAGSVRRTEGFEHGRDAGRTLVLHRPVSSDASDGGKRLTDRSHQP